MKIENVAAFYSVLAAIALMIYWYALYKNDEHTELLETPIKKVVRLGRDIVTAGLLVIGGIGVFSTQIWGDSTYYISMGILILSLCDFTLFYGQRKDWARFGFFALLTVVAIVFIVLMAIF